MPALVVVAILVLLAFGLAIAASTLPLALPLLVLGVATDSHGQPIQQVLTPVSATVEPLVGPPAVLVNAPNARPSQFALGLSWNDAYAACGPAAALAYSVALGRPLGVQQVMAVARRGWWDANVGMHGAASEQGMLRDLGLPSTLEPINWPRVIREASAHRPVILDTPGHYYFANAYDPATGRLHVGTSGTDLRGGSAWMTPAQINALTVSQGAVRADLYLPGDP